MRLLHYRGHRHNGLLLSTKPCLRIATRSRYPGGAGSCQPDRSGSDHGHGRTKCPTAANGSGDRCDHRNYGNCQRRDPAVQERRTWWRFQLVAGRKKKTQSRWVCCGVAQRFTRKKHAVGREEYWALESVGLSYSY
jgi:hypothetical protein